MATRCCSPPDSSLGYAPARWLMPTRASRASARAVASFALTPRTCTGALHHVAEGRTMREEVPVLKHHAHALPDGAQGRAVDALAAGTQRVIAHADGPAVEVLEAVDAPQERALAAPRGAEQGHHLALREAEAHAVNHGAGAVGLGECVDGDHDRPSLSSMRRAHTDRG
jgi:hypothetical protein